jgi:hypothetical protein
MNRQTPQSPTDAPHDYRNAVDRAISWLGDRYLLAARKPGSATGPPKYWTAGQHAAAHHSRPQRRPL